MQFIANGPDIPEELLQAHEEGGVVFFCGAGISYPADLPGFKGLVDKIFFHTGTSLNDLEENAYNSSHYDVTLDLLERRLPGGQLAVRKVLANVLQPNLRRKGATDTHTALLLLGRHRTGALRLVTTNFDRIFEKLIKRRKLSINSYPAPLLPIPKNCRWNGLVYLHGLLPERTNDDALLRLVITSGDFGRAYLTERWAARFVTDLFRNYIVCFIGYSINDQVLRYMMDALAADRMLGEITPQAYAFGECSPGQESNKTIEWEAKGVTPILYEVPADTHDHSALHCTLKAWAETYRDGILGKERIVVDYAMSRPSASTRQDDFVSRMLWALSHDSGLPAKRFAEFDPAPPLEWLEALSTDRYGHGDLARFKVPPHPLKDGDLGFSMVHRPTPYTHAPRMSLASAGPLNCQWDQVMFHIACWLVRHLDDPALILWLAQRGGHLHTRLAWLIEKKLETFACLEHENKLDELERIRAQAPNAIPRPLLRPLWRLMLTDQVKFRRHDEVSLYRWKDRLKRDSLTATLRIELREILSPKVELRKPLYMFKDDAESETPERLDNIIAWDIVLTDEHVHYALRDLAGEDCWQDALPALFDDFQQLLRDALDLMRELGGANDCYDRSYFDLPSISPHWQNRDFRSWIALIELLRDAWLAIRETNPARAAQLARNWFSLPYPTFKRLALFAASFDECIAPNSWTDWLLADDSWWLWSVATKRETLRLLVLQGHHLNPETEERLEEAILRGPPRAMFRDDLEPDSWQYWVDQYVWLRLAKLKSSRAALGSVANTHLAVLAAAHPEWRLMDNDKDEFSHWMSGTGEPDFEEERDVELAPRKRADLVEWLKRPQPPHRPFYEDNWSAVCRKHLLNTGYALWDLARDNLWPVTRWHEALQAWSEKGRLLRSWRLFAPLVHDMPDAVLQNTGHGVTRWMEEASKVLDCHEDILLTLCRRVLALPFEDGVETDDPVTRAINHPVGHVTGALMNLWLKRKPNDNDGLPTELEPYFTQLCDTDKAHFRHGRVLLAARLIALFRVDRHWTEAQMLPLFDWRIGTTEARAVWEGFLWSPRLYRPLLIAFKAQLLETSSHYTELGSHTKQYVTYLTYAALDQIDTYSTQELQTAFGALPQEGLLEAAQALVSALRGAGEQREEYWINRIQPFWQAIWPKSRQLMSKGIAEALAQLSITASSQFPVAFDTVADWLQPIEHLHYIVHLLHESDLIEKFPTIALNLLSALIGDQLWAPEELRQCLTRISHNAPALQHDQCFIKIDEYLRRHGM